MPRRARIAGPIRYGTDHGFQVLRGRSDLFLGSLPINSSTQFNPLNKSK